MLKERDKNDFYMNLGFTFEIESCERNLKIIELKKEYIVHIDGLDLL